MVEFTGERVIPGLVDADLLNEHLARYRFALRFVRDSSVVLDAGCGSGYGAAVLARKARVAAIDIAPEALEHARRNFGDPAISFLQAACEALPFSENAFDLVTAFEVIEHVERWGDLLAEARRVLKPDGILLVSTPNKAYYEESRAEAGPNPFHCHEFEYVEFHSTLSAVFPHVRIWTQNHAESIVFAPVAPLKSRLEADGDSAPERAHFFVAACGQSPIESNELLAWMPRTANLLRERERHIGKLKGELADKDVWLRKLIADHGSLQSEHEITLTELRRSNDWAETLNREVKERRGRIDELQLQLSERLQWVHSIEKKVAEEAQERLDWIESLEERIGKGRAEIERLNEHRSALEADLAARDAWGRSLDAQFRQKAQEVQELWREVQELRGVTEQLAEASLELDRMKTERRMIADSKWVRLGRKFNIGPMVDAPPT